MDQLTEYRRKMQEEKKKQDKIKESQKQKLDPPLTNPPFKGDIRTREHTKAPSWFETKPEENPQQETPLPDSEKVEYRKKLEQKESEQRAKEREDHAKQLERIRQQSKKKKTEPEDDGPKMIYSPVQTEPKTPTSKPCKVQIRMLDSKICTVQFQTEDHLYVVCEYIIQMGQNDEKLKEKYQKGVLISTIHPRHKFTNEEIESLTIEKAGLVNSTINVEASDGGFTMKKAPQYNYTEIELPPWKLKGDTPEAKERFREKIRQEDISKKEKEKREKKKELERLRLQIEQQKKDRKGIKEPIAQKTEIKKEVVKDKIYDHSTIQFRMPNGSNFQLSFKVADTLNNVHQTLIQQAHLSPSDDIAFCIPYLRREFQKNQFGTTLLQAGLVPDGTLTIMLLSQKGMFIKGEPIPEQPQNEEIDME